MYLNNFVKIFGNNIEGKCQRPFYIVKIMTVAMYFKIMNFS